MSCELTLSAIDTRGCLGQSGIESLYFIDKKDREASGVTYDVASGKLSITGTGGQAYHVKVVQNSFSYDCTATPSQENNSLFYLTAINGILHGVSDSITDFAENVNKGRTEILVKFVDGSMLLAGYDYNGLQAAGGTISTSGQNIGDAKGSTINLSGQSKLASPHLLDFADFTTAFTITEPV